MTLPALRKWRSNRLTRLDLVLAAHPHAAGSRTDPAVAPEWTRALVLIVASEFQGFCRDLHDDAAEAIARGVVSDDRRIRDIIISGLTVNRGLNRRGADVQTLEDDFLRLGMALWPSLSKQHPIAAPVWLEALRYLHKARNGVVHDDLTSVAIAQAAGWTLQIDTVRRWRKLVNEIAEAMGCIVNQELAESFGNHRC
jgi:hypothetical protein